MNEKMKTILMLALLMVKEFTKSPFSIKNVEFNDEKCKDFYIINIDFYNHQSRKMMRLSKYMLRKELDEYQYLGEL